MLGEPVTFKPPSASPAKQKTCGKGRISFPCFKSMRRFLSPFSGRIRQLCCQS